jgi:coenzyme F420-reducing hydrogenase delta subunit
MCTGRVDLAFILRALLNGADGVFIGGCWPGECHYVTEGNYDALALRHIAHKLLQRVGVDPGRVRLEWIAASEGTRFAEVVNDFVGVLRGLGPLSVEENGLRGKLAAAARLVPYIRLVERERLRPPERSEAVYNAFYASDETDRLFDELIGDRLVTSEIATLLEEGALSTAEIAGRLGLDPSAVSRQMNSASRQGLVRYDLERQRYALVGAE